MADSIRPSRENTQSNTEPHLRAITFNLTSKFDSKVKFDILSIVIGAMKANIVKGRPPVRDIDVYGLAIL